MHGDLVKEVGDPCGPLNRSKLVTLQWKLP